MLSDCRCREITAGAKPGWIEKLLILLIPHSDIVGVADLDTIDVGAGWAMRIITKQTVLYMRRFYLWRSSWIGKNWGDLYLHHIVRSDDPSMPPHEHGCSYTGYVLSGGYTEQVYHWATPLTTPPKFRLFGPYHHRVFPRTFFSRYATHAHRVVLNEGVTSWTLIRTKRGPQQREWCFLTENGPVVWHKYDKQ